MDVELLIGAAINGVVLGGILALAAIGLTLVYGILKISNFAHGDVLTFGAYMLFAFNAVYASQLALLLTGTALAGTLLWGWKQDRLPQPERIALGLAAALLLALAFLPGLGDGALGPGFIPGILLAMVWTAGLLVAMEFTIWKPLRRQNASIVTMIITSIGIALLLRNVVAMVFGTSIHSYQRPISPPMEFLGYRITEVQIWTLIACAILVTTVHLVLKKTDFGKALRAVADDQDLARISGIDVDRMIRYVWMFAGVLAAIAGMLLALNVNVNTNLGWRLILPIFAAVILGGVGSVYGALLGAFIIALAMELSVLWLPDSGYRLAIGFLILIATILWRPKGLIAR